jgi:hypothetical protein
LKELLRGYHFALVARRRLIHLPPEDGLQFEVASRKVEYLLQEVENDLVWQIRSVSDHVPSALQDFLAAAAAAYPTVGRYV